MPRTKPKLRRASIGPCGFEPYPVSAFSLVRGIDMQEVWRLIGPTVERNLDRPLWLQFCAIYIEGLAHGVGGALDNDRDDEVRRLKAEVLELRRQQQVALTALTGDSEK